MLHAETDDAQKQNQDYGLGGHQYIVLLYALI